MKKVLPGDKNYTSAMKKTNRLLIRGNTALEAFQAQFLRIRSEDNQEKTYWLKLWIMRTVSIKTVRRAPLKRIWFSLVQFSYSTFVPFSTNW